MKTASVLHLLSAASAKASPIATTRPGRTVQFRSQCISFDVAADDKEVLVLLDGNTLETRLIHVSFAWRLIVRMIAHCVGQGNLTEQRAHPAIFGWLN